MAVRHVILWLHLLGVAVWLGGLVCQGLVVRPMLSRATAARDRLRLGLVMESRFRTVMWPAVGLVLFTGLYNVMQVLYATSLAGGHVPRAFVYLLSLKLLFVALMIGIQTALHLLIYPRRVAHFRAMPANMDAMPTALKALEHWSHRLHLLTILLATAAVLLGVMLRG